MRTLRFLSQGSHFNNENKKLNYRLTTDLVGRHGIHAIKVHAVDEQLHLVRTCIEGRRKIIGYILRTGGFEIHSVSGQRAGLVGFKVILQFDGAGDRDGGIDCGRLDRSDAPADVDRFGIHGYGYIRYYSRRGG
jgi:hypothetical protein